MRGVPNLFKGDPIKVPPATGRLKELTGNIQRMQGSIRKVTAQGASKVKSFMKKTQGEAAKSSTDKAVTKPARKK